jgi:hypothetical protein
VSSDLEFDLCDPSARKAPPGWADGIRNAGVHEVWDWSVVRTVAAIGRSRLLAGMFRDGGRIVGLGTARLYGIGGRRRFTGLVDVDCLATSALPGIALAGGIPATLHPDGTAPALFAAALHAFESALRREYGRWVQAVAYRQIYGRELPVVLRGATVVREGTAVAVLHNRFTDHDGYLRSLTKSRRVDQRRLVRNIDADPDVTVWLGPASAANLDVDTFFRLNLSTARRNHRARWPPLRYWRREMFSTVLALPKVEAIRYTDPDGGLIAASVMFDHPIGPVLGPWGARPLGPDRRSGLWFDHLDRLVRQAITAGRPLVIGGKGQAGLKASLGFEPYQQWTVLRRLA